jgi:hypothetical protein
MELSRGILKQFDPPVITPFDGYQRLNGIYLGFNI